MNEDFVLIAVDLEKNPSNFKTGQLIKQLGIYSDANEHELIISKIFQPPSRFIHLSDKDIKKLIDDVYDYCLEKPDRQIYFVAHNGFQHDFVILCDILKNRGLYEYFESKFKNAIFLDSLIYFKRSLNRLIGNTQKHNALDDAKWVIIKLSSLKYGIPHISILLETTELATLDDISFHHEVVKNEEYQKLENSGKILFDYGDGSIVYSYKEKCREPFNFTYDIVTCYNEAIEVNGSSYYLMLKAIETALFETALFKKEDIPLMRDFLLSEGLDFLELADIGKDMKGCSIFRKLDILAEKLYKLKGEKELYYDEETMYMICDICEYIHQARYNSDFYNHYFYNHYF